MSRYRGLIILGILVLLVSTLFFQRSEAQRGSQKRGNTDSNVAGESDLSGKLRSMAPQKSGPAPEVVRLAGFAESAPARTFSPAQRILAANQPGPAELEREEGETEGREINPLNSTEVRANLPGLSVDGALQTSLRSKKGPLSPTVLPGPSLTFEGIDAADEGNSVAPPDTNGDVGPNDYVQTVNNRVRIWDKNGNARGAAFTQSSLFGALGGICSVNNNGDPVVLYDRLANRWLLTQFAFTSQTTPPYHECVAISKSPDPTGAYFLYDFVLPGTEFPDYPKLGVWPDGYYMTTNQFNNGGSFDGGGVFSFQRSKMLIGDPTATAIYFNLDLASHPEGIFGMLPSDHDGLLPPPAGAPNTFLYFTDDQFGDPADGLRLFDFHADFNTPANSTFTERPESTYAAPLALAAFDGRNPGGRGDIEQPPPAGNNATDRLDSISTDTMYRLQYFNRGGTESLVANFTVNVSGVTPSSAATYQAGFRYFELRKASPAAPYAVAEQATFAPGAGNGASGDNRWLGSAAIDSQDNLAVGYSLSGVTAAHFPSLNYAARAFNDPSGGLFQGEGVLFAGTGVQRGTTNRWGDYSALQVDPKDDCTFWFTSEYYTTTASTFNWRTRGGTFKFATCNAPAQGTLAGTITACDSGVPLDGATVTVSGGPSAGFSTTTLPNGTYSMNLAPGSYTVTISSAPHSCGTAGPFNLTINNGATTTQNACLTGTPKTALVSSAISGGNGNGVIDKDECNNLNVTITDIGCLTASNVTAVLSTSTPNVTISQPNSPYPNITVGSNGTNTVPFSVSTSPSFVCGTPIVFTLTVTYAGGSNAINFTLPTCACSSTTVNGVLAAGDPTQTGRMGRDAVTASCGVTKVCPGAIAGDTAQHAYDLYTFTNGPTAACVTITTTATCSSATNPIITVAYLTSFNGTALCTNYLGDPGGSPAPTNSFQVNVPANAALVVNVQEITAGTGCSGYSVNVAGLVCDTDAGAQCAACSITCPANITQANDANQCGAVVTYAAPTSSGTCGAVTCSPASGSFFPVGTTTVNCSTTAGPTCSFTVTVQDTQAPTITCPANITQSNDPNQCGATVNYPAPTVSDNCPGATVNCSPASGSFFPVGTTTVTCTASDASANSPDSTCTFTVTVNDTQPPSITCPANISVPAAPGFDGANVDYPAPTVTDNCPGAPAPVCNPASGSFFPIGVTTVTCTAGGTSCTSKTITHSSSQAITPNNSVSCNNGVGHTDNHYWRAFSLPSFSINNTYHVQSVDIGIEQASSGGAMAPTRGPSTVSRNNRSATQRKGGHAPAGVGGQQVTLLLHTNTGGAFPGGTLNFLTSVSLNVADQSGTILNIPINADVPAGSELVVELFTPDGTAAGNLFFIGSNAAPETGPSYLSAPDCGINSPTTTTALGFPNMHIVMNVHGCEDTTGGLSSSCNFTVTVKPPRSWTTTGSSGTPDEDSASLVSFDDFAFKLKDGLTGTATVRYNITAAQGISAFCPATQSVVYVRFRNSDNAGAHARVKFEIHRTSVLTGGNDITFTFNSDGLSAGNVFTSASLAPNIDFDFSNYVYWIEATVFRDQTGQFADLGSIEIFESDGTLCP
ncbi:MAG: hypothetical protein JWM21_131 [Acidobacteria bacterium]|nr:hypothetical protein [Acidobacteriota bacterium]